MVKTFTGGHAPQEFPSILLGVGQSLVDNLYIFWSDGLVPPRDNSITVSTNACDFSRGISLHLGRWIITWPDTVCNDGLEMLIEP